MYSKQFISHPLTQYGVILLYVSFSSARELKTMGPVCHPLLPFLPPPPLFLLPSPSFLYAKARSTIE